MASEGSGHGAVVVVVARARVVVVSAWATVVVGAGTAVVGGDATVVGLDAATVVETRGRSVVGVGVVVDTVG